MLVREGPSEIIEDLPSNPSSVSAKYGKERISRRTRRSISRFSFEVKSASVKDVREKGGHETAVRVVASNEMKLRYANQTARVRRDSAARYLGSRILPTRSRFRSFSSVSPSAIGDGARSPRIPRR